MGTYKEQRTEPYSAKQLFDIAADIQSYPAFVPMFIAARIIRRDGNRLCVDNVLGVGPLRFRFATEATLEKPDRISIVSVDGRIGEFSIIWRFKPVDEGLTTVTLQIDHRFDSALLTPLSNAVAAGMEHRILNAFEKRLAKIYSRRPRTKDD